MTTITHLNNYRLPAAGKSSADRTRAQLLEAGTNCFSELGFHSASTRLIETAAGVKRNLITHHWGSKEDFWRACVARLMADFIDALAIAEVAASPHCGLDQLSQVIRNFVLASAKYPQVQRIMLDEGKREESRLQWLSENYVAPIKDAIGHILVRAQKEGHLVDLTPATFHYTLLGSSSIFAMSAECRILFQMDPFASAIAENHAESIVRLIIGNTGGENYST